MCRALAADLSQAGALLAPGSRQLPGTLTGTAPGPRDALGNSRQLSCCETRPAHCREELLALADRTKSSHGRLSPRPVLPCESSASPGCWECLCTDREAPGPEQTRPSGLAASDTSLCRKLQRAHSSPLSISNKLPAGILSPKLPSRGILARYWCHSCVLLSPILLERKSLTPLPQHFQASPKLSLGEPKLGCCKFSPQSEAGEAHGPPHPQPLPPAACWPPHPQGLGTRGPAQPLLPWRGHQARGNCVTPTEAQPKPVSLKQKQKLHILLPMAAVSRAQPTSPLRGGRADFCR